MRDGEKKEPGVLDTFRTAYSLFGLACQCFVKPVEVFLRERPGSRYFGFSFGVGVVVYLTFYFYVLSNMNFKDHLNERFTVIGLLFAVASVIKAAAHRAEAWRAFRRGERRHRMYWGDSIFARWWSDDFSKHWAEPLFCTALGIAGMYVSPPLGLYLMIAGFCLRGLAQEADRHLDLRVQAAHDAQAEQEVLAERLRRK